jgi:hypothetical protein
MKEARENLWQDLMELLFSLLELMIMVLNFIKPILQELTSNGKLEQLEVGERLLWLSLKSLSIRIWL